MKGYKSSLKKIISANNSQKMHKSTRFINDICEDHGRKQSDVREEISVSHEKSEVRVVARNGIPKVARTLCKRKNQIRPEFLVPNFPDNFLRINLPADPITFSPITKSHTQKNQPSSREPIIFQKKSNTQTYDEEKTNPILLKSPKRRNRRSAKKLPIKKSETLKDTPKTLRLPNSD